MAAIVYLSCSEIKGPGIVEAKFYPISEKARCLSAEIPEIFISLRGENRMVEVKPTKTFFYPVPAVTKET
ncbi:MAG: hypothetical protein EA411_10350 [Saprospirales bacterium]|nr:MAG: hypothetical protein EA411_10350 [Saprospirales bacterium]